MHRPLRQANHKYEETGNYYMSTQKPMNAEQQYNALSESEKSVVASSLRSLNFCSNQTDVSKLENLCRDQYRNILITLIHELTQSLYYCTSQKDDLRNEQAI